MMSMAYPMAIGVDTLRIDSGCFLKRESFYFYMNPLMLLYLIVDQVDSCHSYVCDS